jgi:hypothetical protein
MIQSVEKVYDELSDNFMYRMVLTDNSIYLFLTTKQTDTTKKY